MTPGLELADVLTLVQIAQREAEENPDPAARVLAGMVIRLAGS